MLSYFKCYWEKKKKIFLGNIMLEYVLKFGGIK